MRPYWAFFRTRFLALLQYRAAAIAGIGTQWLFGFVRVMALWAFYQSAGTAQPMAFEQAAAYTWLGQAMLGMLPWNIEREIGESVRTGSVAYELSRPLDLYAMWFARCMALRSAPTLLRAVPQFLISIFLIPAPFGMRFGGPEFAGWLAALPGALLLSSAVTALMNASLFWTVTGDGVIRLGPVLVLIFSGMTVPLQLLPDWAQTFLFFQPFMGLVDGPAQILAGSMPLARLPLLIALQWGWAAAFIAAGRLVLCKGLTRLEVAGG